MKKTSFILVILLYIIMINAYTWENNILSNIIPDEPMRIINNIIFIAVLILPVLNIISGFTRHRAVHKNPVLAKSASINILIQKIMMTAVYVGLNVFGFLVSFVLLFFALLPVSFAVVALAVFYSYVLMLSTSVPAVSLLIADFRNGVYSKKQLVLGIILQFVFIIEIFGYIYLFIKRRKYFKKQAEALITV